VGGARGGGWHWAPVLLVTFFGVVIATNVVFLGLAERGISGIFGELLPEPQTGRVADSRFPGTVAYDFQEKEHLYNAYLEQVEEQHARGWQVKKGWRERPVVGEPAEFLVQVSDADGRALDDLEVSGQFLRTSNSADDFEFRLQPRGGGFYSLETRMPLPGLWRLLLFVRQGEAVHEIQAITSVADRK
jgi:nitrogen fixation protein FixH